jgi:hypothetical protein
MFKALIAGAIIGLLFQILQQLDIIINLLQH